MLKIAMMVVLSWGYVGNTAIAQDTKVDKASAPKGKTKKKDKGIEVTVLDMSEPDAPESEFPTVSKKGGL